MSTDTGVARFGQGPSAIALPVVTKEDLALYALWAVRYMHYVPSAQQMVTRRLRRLYPILFHPDVLMVAEELESIGEVELAREMRLHATGSEEQSV